MIPPRRSTSGWDFCDARSPFLTCNMSIISVYSVVTEIMEVAAAKQVSAPGGWVLYDGSCALCRATAARFAPMLLRKGFRVLPLQDSRVFRQLKLAGDELLREMRVITPGGDVLGGAVAVADLARHFWWGLPLYWFSRLPGCGRLLASAYAWLAARRHCIGGACSLPERTQHPWTGARIILASAPLLLLPTVVGGMFQNAPPWMLMWAIAASLWLGLKWATLVDAWRVGLRPSVRRVLAYLLVWPNSDALSFLSKTEVPSRPVFCDWFSGVLNTSLGIALFYTGVRLAYPVSPLLSGWVGMIGLVLILHFGVFKLLALAWRHAGTSATLLMRCPIASGSLAEFWGRRWNTGFSGPAKRLLHAPLAKGIGPSLATMCVFLVSGLAHESVISLPAGGGYGLPMAYFLLQAFGLQIERSRVGRRLGLGRGFRGWAFALLMAAGPALLLFHPVFVREVILPFLAALGPLKGVAL